MQEQRLLPLLYCKSSLTVIVVSTLFSDKLTTQERIIGFAVLEKHKAPRQLTLFQFIDSEHCTTLEALLIRYGPGVCYQAEQKEGSGDVLQQQLHKTLQALFDSVGVSGVGVDPCRFRSDGIEQQLRKVLGETSLVKYSKEMELLVGLRALSALLDFEVQQPSTLSYELKIGALQEHMRLDAAALHALNIFQARRGDTAKGSLFQHLNRCKTKKIGAALMKRYLLQPLVDTAGIKNRHDVVQNFADNPNKLEKLRRQLSSVPDLNLLCTRLLEQRASLENLYLLYLLSQQISELCAVLRRNDDGSAIIEDSHLAHLIGSLESLCTPDKLGKYTSFLEQVLDFDHVPREFRVCCEHDKSGRLAELSCELSRLREDASNIQSTLQKTVLSNLGAKYEKEKKFLRIYGYHFRIPKKHDNKLKQLSNSEYLYLKVVNSGIRWTTKSLRQLYDRTKEMEAELATKQKALVRDAVTIASSYAALFQCASSFLSEIDVLQSFAHLTQSSLRPYVRPLMHSMGSEKAQFHIKDSRHPCVELVDGSDFVANDFTLTKGCKFQLITGPNMGGKSTYIRQLGLLCVLAQIGCFIPATDAEMTVVDAIYARVGADDDQLRGASTFMCEMTESASLIRSATKDSLALVDEIGRGTATSEGYGLAYAIAHHLIAETRCFCLFATHYHELGELEDEFAKVIPDHVKNKYFDAALVEKEVVMLYKLKDGICSLSYGINIAKLSGFPQRVIQQAEEKMKDLEACYSLSPIVGFTSLHKQQGQRSFLEGFIEMTPQVLSELIHRKKEATLQ